MHGRAGASHFAGEAVGLGVAARRGRREAAGWCEDSSDVHEV